MKLLKQAQSTVLFEKSIQSLLGIVTAVGVTMLPTAHANTVQFLPNPPDQGAPDGRQRGGATRGDCLAYQGLTALVPEVEGVVWSQTASETPSFFFEIPAALTETVPLEFVIQDDSDNYVFQKQFSMASPAGILEVPVTSDSAGLTLGESYTWTLSIYCDAARPSASVSVSGTINRVVNAQSSNLANEAENLLAQIQHYAESGIWHEALSFAFELNRLNPNHPESVEVVETLLNQAGLTDVVVTRIMITGNKP